MTGANIVLVRHYSRASSTLGQSRRGEAAAALLTGFECRSLLSGRRAFMARPH
jgi:hypothetical protein